MNPYESYDWQDSDKNIVRIVEKLNDKCLSIGEKSGFPDSRYEPFSPSDLDYDYENCRKYCYKKDDGHWNEFEEILCSSCKEILEKEIRLKYNKTKKELGDEIEELKMQVKILSEHVKILSPS